MHAIRFHRLRHIGLRMYDKPGAIAPCQRP